MKQQLILSLFFLSVVFSVFPQDSLKHQAMPPFEITKYQISVGIPESFDRIDVQAKINIKELSPADTLRITLCNGFKGTLAANIKVLNEKEKPLSFIKDSTLLKIVLSENYFKKNSLLLSVSSTATISAYPVPVGDNLNIELTLSKQADVNLLIQSINGQVVYQNNITGNLGNNLWKIDTKKFANGFYILSVVVDEKLQAVRKITK